MSSKESSVKDQQPAPKLEAIILCKNKYQNSIAQGLAGIDKSLDEQDASGNTQIR